MQLNEMIKAGKDIRIVRRDGAKHLATVHDILATTIGVSEVVEGGKRVEFEPGEDVHLLVSLDNDTYKLAAMVQGYQKASDGKTVLKLGAYNSSIPRQKRGMFRLKCEDMTADLLAFSVYDRRKLQFEGPVEVIDLSETGIGLRVRQQLMHNGFVNCRFVLDGEKLGFTGRIVYCLQSRGRYAVGINFLDGSEAQRRSIRRYILCKQVRREE